MKGYNLQARKQAWYGIRSPLNPHEKAKISMWDTTRTERSV